MWRGAGRRQAWTAAAGVLVGAAVWAGGGTQGSARVIAPPAAAVDQVVLAGGADWSGYLHGPGHSSYASAQKVIRPASVPLLVRKWHYAGHGFTSSPVVAGGYVFIGSRSGWFYQFSAATGRILHKAFIGFRDAPPCGPGGVADTAAVAIDPADHDETVYVGGPSGYLYAFAAGNLALKWKSVIAVPSRHVSDYFQWSSPTVANGRIYTGVASQCDEPLVRGAVVAFSQATGRRLAEFHTVPAGVLGGSVWSSVAVGPDGDVYASTGNGVPGAPRLYHTDSIIKLGPAKLRLLGSFSVPRAQQVPDGDFGGSPLTFGRYVGACDKNGIFYALTRATMKLAWERRIGAPAGGGDAQCSAAPAYNGRHLFFGGPAFTIRGSTYRGSVQERSPSSGRLLWATGLPDGVIGSPSLDGGGVLAAGTFDATGIPDATYLINAATGRIIRRLVRGKAFAQSAFARGWLYTANRTGLYAWGLPAQPAT